MASDGAAAMEGVEKQPHRLEKKWTFWFDNQSKPKQGAAWGNNLRKGYTFETVEEFWCLYDQIFRPSKLPPNADFHLFKAGVEPKWEDPECANGGKWTVTSSTSRRASLDTMWLETLMALIGEQFDEADEICGVVASVRQRQDKLSLWTKNAANEAAQVSCLVAMVGCVVTYIRKDSNIRASTPCSMSLHLTDEHWEKVEGNYRFH